jgi:PLP dependent protein
MTLEASDSVRDRFKLIHDSANQAASRTGRSLADITVVAVTKSFSVEKVREAAEAGMTVFGENRVQEAASKIPSVGKPLEWHLIGHLQTNKVKTALELFSLIQSVDSLRLAQFISKECAESGKTARALLEVNISGEAQKYGFNPDAIGEAADQIAQLPGIRIEGLMGIAPLEGGESAKRAAFKNLRNLFDKLKSKSGPACEMKILSMGMSDDFTLAIEEGSTMIRVGRALFGER